MNYFNNVLDKVRLQFQSQKWVFSPRNFHQNLIFKKLLAASSKECPFSRLLKKYF